MLRQKIRKTRLYSGIKQQEMADLIGISISSYCRIENGSAGISKETVCKISNILKINEKELLKYWLADKVYYLIKDDIEIADDAIKIVLTHIGDYESLVKSPDKRRPRNIVSGRKKNDSNKT